jgi:hypothetical protein
VVPDTFSSIWVMNATEEEATVTFTPVGPTRAGTGEKVIVSPGSVVEWISPPPGQTLATSFLVDSTVPVTVAVSHAGERGVALVAAVAIE